MNSFTPRAQQVLIRARKEADRFHHNYIGTEHLLLGLISLGQGVAVNILQKLGIDLETIQEAVERQVGKGTEQEPLANIPYTPRVKKVLALAGKEAKLLNHSYIGTEHILLGLLREGEGVAARVLKTLELDIDRCRDEVLTELDPNHTAEVEEVGESSSKDPQEEPKGVKTPALKAFGRDLTELGSRGVLDPVVGRKTEIQRVIQILCRRTKNNPVLIGEAGVGKTAIVEGLAQQIAIGIVPEVLMDKRIITLDLALMVAGTKYRGQFEERIKTVIDEIRRVKNIIIFIDEIHTIVGAGSAEGAMDASNIFKPALSRGELQTVGATTVSEYRKFIEKNGALDRRFQAVIVEAPSPEESLHILKGIRQKYQDHHKVIYSDKSLEAAVRLSHRYITGRYLPDKAIDVIDEAGAYCQLKAFKQPIKVNAFNQKIEKICIEKEETIRKQLFEKAAQLRDREKQIRAQRDQFLKEWKEKQEQKTVSIEERDILQVVADMTGIPLQRMERKETEKLLNLERDLQTLVVGQQQATEAVAKALRRSRADLKDPRRPIGSFLFLGPTGVGKSHLAKCLADRMYGGADALIQIDMSEYMEKIAGSRLIGSPPGYIGYEEGGQLTEAVKHKPYSIILFDELEKAHPDVIQLLLQVLEEGRLTDSMGRVVDFRNTILILTSNIGADLLQRNVSLGFKQAAQGQQDFERLKEKISERTKQHFKPEFLNRISDTVIFRPLLREDMEKIVEIELAKVGERLVERKTKLQFAKKAKDFLVEKGYDEKYGARPLCRAIERYVEDPLAEAILKGDIKMRNPIRVTVKGDRLIFEQVKTSKVS